MKKLIALSLMIVMLSVGIIAISPQEIASQISKIIGGAVAQIASCQSQLLKTGQTTTYFIWDDGDQEIGITKAYTILTVGQYSGTVNVDSPHYAAATIAFAATTPGTITDAAGLLATVLTGDTIRIYNSTLNNGVYTVSAGGVAGIIRTTEATVAELAGAYITILKRASHSNNTVRDDNTCLQWARYVQTGRVGPTSDGRLNWYNAATCFILHPAAADLAMVTGNILRITGVDESSRYFAGMVLDCGGFANAVNNLPGLVVISVGFAGGNTDIVVNPGNQTLIAEVAGGVRTISIVCQNIYAYVAAANAALLGGYGDWRVVNLSGSISLLNLENASPAIDTVVFPSFPGANIPFWTSNTIKINSDYSVQFFFSSHINWPIAQTSQLKTASALILLVRGG